MSELAPGSPWYAIVLPGLAPARAFAMKNASPIRPAEPEKPRYIRDLRRSAARSRRRDRILLTGLRPCYSNVRKRSGRDFDGVFQHDGGLFPGLRVVRDGDRQGVQRA